jgi:hypothetical protein
MAVILLFAIAYLAIAIPLLFAIAHPAMVVILLFAIAQSAGPDTIGHQVHEVSGGDPNAAGRRGETIVGDGTDGHGRPPDKEP